ncbi:hypothetical protein ACOMHN_040924 [Nucella lapillus]
MASGRGDCDSTLQCPSCTKQYQEPRLLPCFHSLCLQCLTKKLSTGDFPCPTCLSKISPPPEGVDVFPVDAYMETQLLKTNEYITTVCDVCEENDVSHKCVQCEQCLCDDCSKIHSRLTMTRAHTLLMLTSGSQQFKVINKQRFCNTHAGEKFRFFCDECRTVICRDCKLTTHQSHSAEDFSQVSQTMLKSMQMASLLCQSQLQPKLEEAVSEAERYKEELAATMSSLLAGVKKRAEEVKDFVDRHVKIVDKQAHEISNNLEDSLNAMKSTLASLELSSSATATPPPATRLSFVHAPRGVSGGFPSDPDPFQNSVRRHIGFIRAVSPASKRELRLVSPARSRPDQLSQDIHREVGNIRSKLMVGLRGSARD